MHLPSADLSGNDTRQLGYPSTSEGKGRLVKVKGNHCFEINGKEPST